ncbi:MAG: Mov34/MPN/PAD-1 family protein [Planctomycetia bacterium]|nr:Mov34/MPN/PAD-1 family protein [Planctomycetia bacterium]
MARASATKRIVENCWVLVGEHKRPFWHARRVRPTRGKPASVEFDAAWVLRREEEQGDVVGFYHTHPSGPPQPSSRDDRTMRAWAGALGKPLLCLIEADGAVAAFRYDDDESAGAQLAACERFARSVVIAYEADRAHDKQGKARHDGQ